MPPTTTLDPPGLRLWRTPAWRLRRILFTPILHAPERDRFRLSLGLRDDDRECRTPPPSPSGAAYLWERPYETLALQRDRLTENRAGPPLPLLPRIVRTPRIPQFHISPFSNLHSPYRSDSTTFIDRLDALASR